MRLFRFITPMLLALLVLPVQAQNYQLTNRLIDNFISSIQDFHTIEAEFEGLDTDDSADDFMSIIESDADMAAIISASMEDLLKYSSTPAYKTMEDFATKHGSQDLLQWADVSSRVSLAFYAISAAEMESEVREQMAQMMRELEQSGMSEEQKQQIMSFTGVGMSMMERHLEASTPEDIAAIRPHFDRIQQAFESLE